MCTNEERLSMSREIYLRSTLVTREEEGEHLVCYMSRAVERCSYISFTALYKTVDTISTAVSTGPCLSVFPNE